MFLKGDVQAHFVRNLLGLVGAEVRRLHALAAHGLVDGLEVGRLIIAVALAPFFPKPGGRPFWLARGHFGGHGGARSRRAGRFGTRWECARLRHCGRGRCGGLLHAVGGAHVRGELRKEGSVSPAGGLR